MATITVTNNNDSGDGSLRAAVEQAELTAGADTIQFSAAVSGKTIELKTVLRITNDLTIDGDIDGDSKADVIISGGDVTQILEITETSTDVNLNSLTLTNGKAEFSGGAVFILNAKVNITDCTIKDSAAGGYGGGLYLDYSNRGVTIVNSLITGNSANGEFGQGGGVWIYGGKTTIINTTIHDNATSGVGGGVFTGSDNELIITNSTITGNTANGDGAEGDQGGGLAAFNIRDTIVINTVIAENVSGTGGTANDTNGTIDVANNSIFGTGALFLAGGGNLVNAGDVGLGELLDNGGAVLTLSPLDGSILIGFGNNSLISEDFFDLDGDGNVTETLPFDARLLARIIDGIVDVGAVEQTVNETIFGTLGSDKISGGEGRDMLFGLDNNDRIAGGQGRDFVVGGLGKDWLKGDSGNDNIKAGDGNDVVIGGGNKDRLAGGDGDDRFFLANHAGSMDEIVDFVSGTDQLLLQSDLFVNLPEGGLGRERFVSNTSGQAEERDDRLIYNEISGELFYDSNGNRSGGSELIAVFKNLAALQSSDFEVI